MCNMQLWLRSICVTVFTSLTPVIHYRYDTASLSYYKSIILTVLDSSATSFHTSVQDPMVRSSGAVACHLTV